MDEDIKDLDDAQAVRVATTFARAQLHPGGESETVWTPELEGALRSLFPVKAGAVPVSKGDLARQVLLLLADDAKNRDTLTALIKGPSPESFEVIGAGSVALIAATL